MKKLACGLAVMMCVLTACGAEAVGDPHAAPADESATAAPVTLAAPAAFARDGDVSIDSCILNPSGATAVQATITNSGDRSASYVATVEISQNGKRVDGVGLISAALEAGATAQASETGVRSGLVGDVECRIVDVSAVPG